jgi:DNA-binding PadR family transcriptional regulator
MAELPLTPTSYLVLGLVGHLGRCTSYQMKQAVARSIGYFWTFPHSQLYAEPARLAAHGLLNEEQEAVGRRRRTYTLTDAGRAALEAWLETSSVEVTEIRDLALLKLFFGSQTVPDAVRGQAEAAVEAHTKRLSEYEAIAAGAAASDPLQRRTLDLGLTYERVAVAFWSEVAAEQSTDGQQPRQPTRPAPTNSSQ